MRRRSFLSWLAALIPATLFAQHAAMQDGRAVVCKGSTVKCPLGHETCREIDAPPVVGNGQTDYPEWAQLISFRMLRCQVCGILFAEKY